jgi:2-oxoglutarate dehydrogenase E1 component
MSDADLATLLSAENGAYVEGLFEDHVLGRGPVPAHWVELFDRLLGRSPASNGEPRRADGAAAAEAPPVSAAPILGTVPSAVGIVGLINAYRTHGHLIANLDPLGRDLDSHPFLDPGEYGIGPERMEVPANCGHFLGAGEATPRQLIELLRETYCGSFAVEFMEMREKERRDWLIERMEPIRNRPQLSREERVRSLMVLLAAEQFEQFLHKRFLGQKRFSIEGGDALIPLFDFLIEDAERLGGRELVIAMAHRGRLNVLVHTMGVPYRAMLAQFRVGLQPRDAQGAGDVKYHRGFSCDRRLRSGHSIHLSLCANPSHLEAINPVAEGMVRAKQNYFGDTDRSRVMTVLVHGDAAFTGQGMVAETLSLSELDSYTTGGTIHLIVNNQIGFTTDPRDYRFTRHPSDLAKIVQAPVFHVNADDPEACVHAARLAIEFRQRFHEDVIIDLVCYRRHGHNEGDDPSFTQPTLYKQIATHPTVGTLYTQRLLDEGILDAGQVESIRSEQLGALERAFEESAEEIRLEGAESYRGLWEGFSLPETESEWGADTRVPREVLLRVAECFTSFPEDFEPHPKIKRLMTQRREAIESGAGIDWGAAEALAFGTLLLEGHIIRLTGQDVERGTFSHRHAVLHDYRSSAPFIPLNTLRDDGDARLFIRNSLLSEAAVLGFEYGYSTVDPKRLAIWEAQFGDFANSAQVIIDQFISSAETKWGRASGLVMLLPHGYEGQGPEHSSARLERFLQLCAEDNLQVCNLSTAAQYFHALRRQLHRPFRKPLIVMAPKLLLRHPAAAGRLEDLVEGTFRTALDDPRAASGALDPERVRRVLLCSGKVYYTLEETREEHAFDDVAILRLEQLHPFPFEELGALLGRYGTDDVVWVQEEPWNQGAWFYVQERIRRVLKPGAELRYVGRNEAASTATGSFRVHTEQENELVRESFAPGRRLLRS